MANSKVRMNFVQPSDRGILLGEHISKLVAALGVAVVTSVGAPPPPALKKLTWLVILLVFTDTLAGVYVAIWTKTLESHRLVEKLAHKGVLYGILMLIGFVPCAIFEDWACAYGMALLMVIRECLSLIENAKRLMMGGKDFGKLSAFLDRISSVLAISAEQALAVVKVETAKGEAAIVEVKPKTSEEEETK